MTTGGNRQANGERHVVVVLLQLEIDFGALVRISQRYALIHQGSQVCLNVFREDLSCSLGSNQERLSPVVRIVQVLDPAADEDRHALGANLIQQARPGQTDDLDAVL